MVASVERLGWTVSSANLLTTDDGTQLDLLLDPPVVVKRECVASVRRWRDRFIFAKYSHLGSFSDSHGLMLGPLWRLLRAPNSVNWEDKFKGALRAAVADRQWAQDRCWTAGFAEHDRCMLCVDQRRQTRTCVPCDGDVAERAADVVGQSQPSNGAHSASDIQGAPVGTLVHRVCQCPQLSQLRSELAPEQLLRSAVQTLPPWELLHAFSSGLFAYASSA